MVPPESEDTAHYASTAKADLPAPDMNPAIDAYIQDAAPFARPILTELRQQVHQTLPGVREQIKWGMPFFCLQHNLCFMAAFKTHCGFGFWRADALGLQVPAAGSTKGMGQFGKILSCDDLPPSASLQALLLQAAALDASPVVAAPRRRPVPVSLAMPEVLAQALQQHDQAGSFFRQMTITQQNDYIQWLLDAKTDVTRQKRLDTIIQWLAEHKTRNWKYMK